MNPLGAYRAIEAPERDLREYRYRLNSARRKAIRGRLQELMGTIDEALPLILSELSDDPTVRIDLIACDHVRASLPEIERLLGDAAPRAGRWSDLWRHLHFSQAQDWRDISEVDWPDVKARIDQVTYAELDPIPVSIGDLGEAAAANPRGPVATALAWGRLEPEGFERLLYNVLSATPGWQNVQWLTKTNAPDRGRDISAERVISDAAGGVRTERVIVQAKHWQTRSVNAQAIAEALTQASLWQPPVIHTLVVATSGRFSADGVAWYEMHNQRGQLPLIELWPDSHLERLLASHPALAAELR